MAAKKKVCKTRVQRVRRKRQEWPDEKLGLDEVPYANPQAFIDHGA